MPAGIDRQDFQDCLLALAKHLPGDDVGMMLPFRHDDFVAGVNEGLAERESDQVDRRRSAGGEHDLCAIRRVQEIPDRIPRTLIRFGRFGRQMMDRPVQVRIGMRRQSDPAVNDGLGPLNGRRVVEIDKRLAIDFLGKDRKLVSKFGNCHVQSCKDWQI